MDKLFTPVKINKCIIPNRFMKSPTYMHDCDSNGFAIPKYQKFYRDLADGKMGLITLGYFATHSKTTGVRDQACLHTDAHAEGWRDTIDYIHSKGSKTLMQIADCRNIQKDDKFMTTSDISEAIELFISAAKRAQNVGADGIELHAAHGYLLSQYLSPVTNTRDDLYGGSFKNRIRMVQEIVEGIRRECGKDFIIAAKINADDSVKGGNKPEDAAKISGSLKDVDLFEYSYGLFIAKDLIDPTKFINLKNGWNVEALPILRKGTNAKISIVDRIRTKSRMLKAIERGADLLSFGRPTIADQFMVQHLMEGKPVRCISCNQCMKHPNVHPIQCWEFK
ncbi:oxidoreductase, FAD/FMN-binding family protein [Trichomonas vaginalis G3]|uniref:Oxidoreductase, FAD/FMN-binding family protein n=1 Tax=Trichomonas vaginalis (strain ATCC PRA-98 / G3) TaxID=412133 RepID=A2E5Z0_TRIV3|nr:FMN binding [Trichomonas vaginalis G3]EAY11947.1 oxidoreductase, FAD/FMN-binding family protein [Trichomonas vaginalis G3]KAI5530388.1 FMN binding [Trichomonas vaginalis G3]|eukprot:XP_001324170.1 oxidoreductase, FAD/FMN-binding family protein [Trichomonas vaginalis G3]